MTDPSAAAERPDTIDTGPVERANQRGGLSLGSRIQTEAGIVTHRGAAANVECLLDALRQTGLLEGREGSRADRAAVARSRYEQGQWLRQLFMRAGLNTVHAMDLNAKRGTGDISDDVARARMRYNRIVRELGLFASAVTDVVCHDEIKPGERQLALVRKGLDKLCILRS